MNSYQRLKQERDKLIEEVKELNRKLFNVVNYPNKEDSIIEILNQRMCKRVEDSFMAGNPSILRVDFNKVSNVIEVTINKQGITPTVTQVTDK